MQFMNGNYLTYDDVLITPLFSDIKSRKDVFVGSDLGKNLYLELPVISANMDTVTGRKMCETMRKHGGVGCLHRFMSTEDTKKEYKAGSIVSFGLGESERERVRQLMSIGAKRFCLDVAHGAQQAVVDQVKWFQERYGQHAWLMVGNFASKPSLDEFASKLKNTPFPDAIKIGIGPGSACTTRIKTGVGFPQLSAIDEAVMFKKFNDIDVKIIADGGIRTPGDVAKAIGAGADAVMVGGMLAGTYQTPIAQRSMKYRDYQFTKDLSKVYDGSGKSVNWKLTYRGSASKEAYHDQGKDWDCAEGESMMIPYRGSVVPILKDIEGGLRSAFTYVGAKNIKEFQEKVIFIKITNNTVRENKAHGKD